ncbi:hypothetical protein [Xenorhabdus littoralis]|uniref:hypothetical protein n=1 Tax=Xenorhabdus littoralis TaxID=2582835 RepID=UPI0029E80BCD|nr:hypothetical protein [Xenorhabdus sp. psl]MDX7992073.1 hypothetical protein [Xenorhabdus sp. psl]
MFFFIVPISKASYTNKGDGKCSPVSSAYEGYITGVAIGHFGHESNLSLVFRRDSMDTPGAAIVMYTANGNDSAYLRALPMLQNAMLTGQKVEIYCNMYGYISAIWIGEGIGKDMHGLHLD